MDGEAGKQIGMTRAARASNPAWWIFTLECVKEVAYRMPYFSMDEVEALRIARRGPGTHEHRANGPLLAYAAKLGYCAPTIDWAPSNQKRNHKRPMRVWRSRIYRGPIRFRPPLRKPLDPHKLQFDPLQRTRWSKI